jgi:hypothetical protein
MTGEQRPPSHEQNPVPAGEQLLFPADNGHVQLAELYDASRGQTGVEIPWNEHPYTRTVGDSPVETPKALIFAGDPATGEDRPVFMRYGNYMIDLKASLTSKRIEQGRVFPVTVGEENKWCDNAVVTRVIIAGPEFDAKNPGEYTEQVQNATPQRRNPFSHFEQRLARLEGPVDLQERRIVNDDWRNEVPAFSHGIHTKYTVRENRDPETGDLFVHHPWTIRHPDLDKHAFAAQRAMSERGVPITPKAGSQHDKDILAAYKAAHGGQDPHPAVGNEIEPFEMEEFEFEPRRLHTAIVKAKDRLGITRLEQNVDHKRHEKEIRQHEARQKPPF